MKRILVPVDASPNSLAALEVAAEMAAGQQAELVGLFVEDSDLLRFTEHGFAKEVSLFSSSLRTIHRQDLELQFRARAERIRRTLIREAEKRGIAWRFRVARGTVHSEILKAAMEADLIVLGKAGWSKRSSGRAGSTVHALISGSGSLTLVLQQGDRIRRTIRTVYTGSVLSKRTLSAIPELLRLERFRIIVYIPLGARNEFIRLRREATALLPTGTWAEFRALDSPYCIQLLREIARGEPPGTVILPCEPPDFQGEPLKNLVNGSSAPVLLVQRSREEPGPEETE